MSPDKRIIRITHNNLNEYLKELAKEFRRLNGTRTPAEIILIGGAAILANYGFRDFTYDIDAIIVASSAMKDAIAHVGDKYGLPRGWMNADFKRTASYSDKLFEVSVFYKTFSNILTVRTVTAEYLLAMKLMSGRRYKNDLSDIIGVLWEQEKNGKPISREAIDGAVALLYGSDAVIPKVSGELLNTLLAADDYETLYRRTRDEEIESREILNGFERRYPGKLTGENIESVLRSARREKPDEPKKSTLALLEEKKRLVNEAKQSANWADAPRRRDDRELD